MATFLGSLKRKDVRRWFATTQRVCELVDRSEVGCSGRHDLPGDQLPLLSDDPVSGINVALCLDAPSALEGNTTSPPWTLWSVESAG